MFQIKICAIQHNILYVQYVLFRAEIYLNFQICVDSKTKQAGLSSAKYLTIMMTKILQRTAQHHHQNTTKDS